jgi:DNA polymerase-3 subunit epsilon
MTKDELASLKIENICIFDTETTGIDAKDHETIEAACALYNIKEKAVIETYASLIKTDHNEAVEINEIPVSLLQLAPSESHVWENVSRLFNLADVIIAHRVEFDIKFVPENLAKLRPWCCSKFDILWPRGKEGSDLLHLALAHGVGVVHAHRALSDVDTLVRLFTRVDDMGHDLEAMIRHGMRPKSKWIAMVSFQQKDLAKNCGFAWDNEKKEWYKNIGDDDKNDFPFKIKKAV